MTRYEMQTALATGFPVPVIRPPVGGPGLATDYDTSNDFVLVTYPTGAWDWFPVEDLEPA